MNTPSPALSRVVVVGSFNVDHVWRCDALPVAGATIAGRYSTGPGGKGDPVAARAAIVLDGPGDVGAEQPAFDALCQFSAVDPFMGAAPEAAPARYTAISPATTAPQLAQILFVQAKLPAPSAATQTALGAGGAKVAVRENVGQSHFAIITPGNPAYTANEAEMLAVMTGGE